MMYVCVGGREELHLISWRPCSKDRFPKEGTGPQDCDREPCLSVCPA